MIRTSFWWLLSGNPWSVYECSRYLLYFQLSIQQLYKCSVLWGKPWWHPAQIRGSSCSPGGKHIGHWNRGSDPRFAGLQDIWVLFKPKSFPYLLFVDFEGLWVTTPWWTGRNPAVPDASHAQDRILCVKLGGLGVCINFQLRIQLRWQVPIAWKSSSWTSIS